MNNCKDCKYWEQDEQFNDYLKRGYGLCEKINLGGNMVKDHEEVDLGQKLAFTEDGSGYKANLYTLPMFGCQLWECK